MTPPLRLSPPPPPDDDDDAPARLDARRSIVPGRTHSPHWQPDRASPPDPKSVWRTLCLKVHSTPVAASHVMERGPERPSIVVVRSICAPGAPQKLVPGMHVQRRS